MVNDGAKTIGHYIENNMAALNKCKTKADLITFIEGGRTDQNSNYLDKDVLTPIRTARDFKKAMCVIGNVMLAGRNLKVLKV